MNGDVIHCFRATDLNYLATAIKFGFKLLFVHRERHKLSVQLEIVKKKP